MIPGNMVTPPLKLAEGEEIIKVQPALRRKGVFGNRYGELYITNQRVAFVKSIMKAGLMSAAAKKKGAKPMFTFEAITNAEKVAKKKTTALVVSDASRTERFDMGEEAIGELIALLQTKQSS